MEIIIILYKYTNKQNADIYMYNVHMYVYLCKIYRFVYKYSSLFTFTTIEIYINFEYFKIH